MSAGPKRLARLLAVRRVQLALAARRAAQAAGEVAALSMAGARLEALRGALGPAAGPTDALAAKAAAGLRTAVGLAAAAQARRLAAARTALAGSLAERARGQAAVEAVERRLAAAGDAE